jgi:hypothetical protein
MNTKKKPGALILVYLPVLVLALIVATTILYFRYIFFDQYEKVPQISDALKLRLQQSEGGHVQDSLKEYNIQLTIDGIITRITNGRNSWQVRMLTLIIVDINPSHLTMLTGNYGWDSGYKMFLLPSYSDLHILSTPTLDELATFRISGYIHGACVDSSYVYFSFADGTFGRVSLDRVGQR